MHYYGLGTMVVQLFGYLALEYIIHIRIDKVYIPWTNII